MRSFPPKITIISPAADASSYQAVDFLRAWGYAPLTLIASASTTTVAALIPAHWEVNIIDEAVMPIDWASVGPVVGITGKTIHQRRMQALAQQCRAQGRLVIIGGSYASLNPEDVADWCDILVVGEIEDIAERLFSDIESGQWQARYDGGKPDLTKSPPPRWDLYPNHLALCGVIQTSRGCPFECDFCDVIAYVGRKQRHKTNEQVISELDQLYRLGYRSVFLADDNLTVYRRRAASLLESLKAWNALHAEAPVAFGTQVSIEIAQDDALLALAAEAGLRDVFIGIETPNRESLRLSKKRQNLGVDLTAALERFVRHRVAVSCGIIVGFDTDRLSIFEEQVAFINGLPAPNVSIAPLTAPPQTPLYARLQKEGRIAPEETSTAQDPFTTNIIPLRMTRRELLDGVQYLVNSVYDIDAFMMRIRRFVALWGGETAPQPLAVPQAVQLSPFAAELLKRLSDCGPREKKAIYEIINLLGVRPWLINPIIDMLTKYAQVRHLFQQTWSGRRSPLFSYA